MATRKQQALRRRNRAAVATTIVNDHIHQLRKEYRRTQPIDRRGRAA